MDIVILVLGVLAGAAIVLGFLNLFNIGPGLLNWLLAPQWAASSVLS